MMTREDETLKPTTGNRSLVSFFFCFVLLMAIGLAMPTRVANSQQPAKFTVTFPGGLLRGQPLFSAPSTLGFASNETYAATARTANNIWVQVQTPNGAGWILAQYGKLDGDINTLPVATPPSVQAANRQLLSPFVSGITPKAKKLYAAKSGNKNFSIATSIGDCNSVPEAYFGRLSAGLFDSGKYPALAPTVEKFGWSFGRNSQASFRGFNSTSMFDASWANPAYCQPDEGVLACELRRSQASVVFVSLGTGDQFTWKEFETNYRRIIEYLIQQNRVPVLITKADDLDSQQGGAAAGFINITIKKLGSEYGVPVVDFYAATRSLKNYGLRWEGNENFHLDEAGSDLKVLLSLQALDALTRK